MISEAKYKIGNRHHGQTTINLSELKLIQNSVAIDATKAVVGCGRRQDGNVDGYFMYPCSYRRSVCHERTGYLTA